MRGNGADGHTQRVALLAEGVGRNPRRAVLFSVVQPSPSSRRAWVEIRHSGEFDLQIAVALLAEGVGRNHRFAPRPPRLEVALLAEGVGRNQCFDSAAVSAGKSPSSRRAWVEIVISITIWRPTLVALLAEGVGRNAVVAFRQRLHLLSPSSRRAWVEMCE